MATCCQPWQKSREIGATWYQPWHLSWVETRTYWTSIIERTTIGLCLSRHKAAEVYFYGRGQTCRNQSNVWNSRKLLHVTLKFETTILRSDIYLPRWTSWTQAQRSKIWGSVSGRDRVARARCPRSSVETGQKCIKLKGARKSNIFLTFGIQVLACVNSSNLRNENLLSTPARQCIWSAKRTWVMLKWILWRNRAVLR